MNPLISVIVPVYNVEKFLNQCVDSILAQTYKNFELILVDDGSKDKSGDICDDYAKNDTRIRVFHKENGGVSSARNYGLDNAQGEYVCFVDSDDWVDETYIEDMVKFGEYDLVMQGMKFNNKAWKYTKKLYNSTIEILQALTLSVEKRDFLFNGPYSKLYRFNIIRNKKLKFNEKIWLGEDFLFNINYLGFARNAYLANTCSYNYRTTPDSLTHKFAPIDDLLVRANAFKYTVERISKETGYKKLYYVIVSEMIEGLFRKCYRVNRKRNERFMAYSFFKQSATSEMFKFMSFPYSKFKVFLHVPFALSDTLLVVIFKIMNKIKAAPQY